MDIDTSEASKPPKSSSTTSGAAAVEEVRQAIRAELTQNVKNLGINPEGRENPTLSDSVIDLVTASTSSPILSTLAIIPSSMVFI